MSFGTRKKELREQRKLLKDGERERERKKKTESEARSDVYYL